jgi:hypothetical protein
MGPRDAALRGPRPILRSPKARAAYLIGSCARGTARDASDIDLIEVPGSECPAVEHFKDHLLGDSTAVAAMLDPLLHHAHLIERGPKELACRALHQLSLMGARHEPPGDTRPGQGPMASFILGYPRWHDLI